jgi:3-oxoacyl-[acyl-carrier-protein] synthase II
MLGDFQARKLAPTIDVRRTDPLNRYAMVAAALALKNSKLEVRASNSDRIGMVMSLNYGSIAVQERFRDSLVKDGIEKMSAKHFPSMVVSTIGGTVSQAFNLRGPNSTIAEGISGGLHGIIHASELLYGDANHDAMVVVGADEIGAMLFHVFDKRGWLAPTEKDQICELGAYQSGKLGWLLGEGGVALVIERASVARARGAKPLAALSGYALSADAVLAPAVEPSGKWHRYAIEAAIAKANTHADAIDLVYGHGRGNPVHDAREVSTYKNVFGHRAVPLGCVMGNVGVAGSSSGLFSTAAALLSIQHNEAYPVIGTSGDLVDTLQLVREHQTGSFRQVLVTGSTENGNNAAIILKNVE